VIAALLKDPALDVNCSQDGKAAIHYLCENGHAELARHLIFDRGVSIIAKDAYLQTPIHYACCSKNAEEVLKVAFLDDASGSVVLRQDLNGQYPDINATDHDGDTPLMWAVYHSVAPEVISLLFSVPGIDAAAANDAGKNALDWVSLDSHGSFLKD
jgi:ankyrin repeat protein